METYHNNEYVITGIPDADSQKVNYWISKKGNTDAYFCFSSDNHQETDYQITNGFDSYIRLYENNHTRLTARDFDIQTPLGTLRVYSKHNIDNPVDFPGVYVDIKETNDMLACVEYDSANQTIQTCVYQPTDDTPVSVTIHNINDTN